MPRDGSGIYTTPVGTTAVPDTTIESAKYNANVNDVAADLNAPRPIVAGGTGATSAGVARLNLKAEVAGQQVTNYDTHVWENGSFWSAGGATGAPDPGHGFAGSCTIYDVGTSFNYIAIEARDVSQTPVGTLYVRMKSGGTWSGWIAQPANPAADYVNATGDTMTGSLTLSSALNPQLFFNKPPAGYAQIIGMTSSVQRWTIDITDGGGPDNFNIRRHNDAGVAVDLPIYIERATGIVHFDAAKIVAPKGVDYAWGPVRFAALGGNTVGWDINNSGTFQGIWDRGNSPAAGTSNGYQKFESGIILQWGFIGSVASDITVNLPLTFPTSPLAAIATISGDAAAVNAVIAANVVAITTAQIRIQGRYVLSGGAVGGATQGCHWFAVGY